MKKFLKYLIVILLLGGLAAYGLNHLVVQRGQQRIACAYTEDGFTLTDNAPQEFFTNRDMEDPGTLDLPDCILVLGAGLSADGSPSPMLRDRLDMAIYLYREGYAPKILLSGDNGQEEYNEIKAMLDYTVAQGVPLTDIFCDYAGFSTYESMYRARDVFEVQSAIVVTQRYHLYRALYIGNFLGLEVYGAASDQQQYRGRTYRLAREVLARDKDVFSCLFHREPTYLGEPVPITGPANATLE